MNQKLAFDILASGRNVFLTGIAGGGKTFLLNEYIAYLKERGIKVGVTASTGIAAIALGGRTIHSFSGMGIKEQLTEEYFQVLLENKFVRKRIRNIKVLIIDEISMLSAKQLDLVDTIFRRVRASNKAFGGVQVVFCGDFIQLPPVGSGAEFAFLADSWKKSDLAVCFLNTPFRQKEELLLRVLNAIRSNTVTSQIKDILYARQNSDIGKNDILLFSRNEDVDAYNATELAKLHTGLFSYTMTETGQEPLLKTLKKNCLSPEVLEVCPGAKVMVTRNIPKVDIVNGTQARVLECRDASVVIQTFAGKEVELYAVSWVVSDEEDRELAAITQIPLRLAYAMTIHKAQGMTLDNATIDLSRVFESGQGYVALSRLRSIRNLSLRGVVANKSFAVNEACLKQEKEFIKQSEYLEKSFGATTNELLFT